MKSIILGMIIILGAAGAAHAYTKSEVVAATIIMEAGGEYDKGAMEAINEVIRCRAKKRKLDPDKVCLQYKQFSCWNNRGITEGIDKAKKHPRWERALAIATCRVTTQYTGGADHYHADYVNPYWVPSMTKTVKIGRHIFYK